MLVIMFRFSSIFIALALTGCTEATIKSNDEYVKNVMNGFRNGQFHSDVTSKLEYITGKEQETWNYCIEEFEVAPRSCIKGYSLIAVVSLPKHHWWLKKGTGQLYFTFDSELKLTEHYYEIYYPRFHE